MKLESNKIKNNHRHLVKMLSMNFRKDWTFMMIGINIQHFGCD